ncbi:MAG: ornithine carbamoyltransferase [Opitutales bacterium]
MRHFLKETDFSAAEAAGILAHAKTLKGNRGNGLRPLDGQSWGMLFFKNSTRTRISFDVGIYELGGHPLMLDASKMQLSRGESPADTVKVLSRYLDGLVVRCHDHSLLETFAEAGSVPVVNALSDSLHPCQVYADAFTMVETLAPDAREPEEVLEALSGRKLAFLGDASCNMANSLLMAGAHLGFAVALSGPEAYGPSAEGRALLEKEDFAAPHFTTDPVEAVDGADFVYTDVWVSMGAEGDADQRLAEMAPYQVTPDLMAKAAPGAKFLHCLPAHPGEEVAQAVLDSEASVIFDQAENRLHVQKAILAALVRSES